MAHALFLPTLQRWIWEIIHELFTNCIACIDVLGEDAEFRAELVSALERLAPLQN